MDAFFGFFGFFGRFCRRDKSVGHHKCLADSCGVGLVVAGVLARPEMLLQRGFNLAFFSLSVACDLFLDSVWCQLIPLIVDAPYYPVSHACHLCLPDHCLRKRAERSLFADKIGWYTVLFDIGKEKRHGFQYFIELLAMGLCLCFIVDIRRLKI